MLKRLKCTALSVLEKTGVFALARRSRWRSRRLLILCYHGLALDDEHLWNPGMYFRPEDFARRLTLLKESRCNVLPLSDALARLHAGELPPMSVAITFDDGTHDFYTQAWPLLKSYGFPVTVYLTTYYSAHNLPVFDVTCDYLLWKGAGKRVDVDGLPLDLTTPAGCEQARRTLRAVATDADAKDLLLRRLAVSIGFDYDGLVRRRMFHVLAPEQVRELAAAGVDFELHTHRHRTPRDRALFRREIRDNSEAILEMTGRAPRHFCYPSGDYAPEFPAWLAEESVVSATTCEAGLCSPQSPPLLLPRLLDHSSLAPVEVRSWLTGCAAFFPRRSPARPPEDLLNR